MKYQAILNEHDIDILNCTNFFDFYHYIKNNFAVKESPYYNIEAVFVPDKESLEIVKRYFQLAHSYCINGNRKYPTYIEPMWFGMDWYFDVYVPDVFDDEGQSKLESLREKEHKFKQLKDELSLLERLHGLSLLERLHEFEE